MSSYLQAAFDAVCENAKQPEGSYVSLVEDAPFYGGPEEGGWWGTDRIVVAYQWFSTREAADAAKVEIEKLAAEQTVESQREHGKQCLRELDWLEARGLEADWLPEPDGPSKFHVMVTDEPSPEYNSWHAMVQRCTDK